MQPFGRVRMCVCVCQGEMEKTGVRVQRGESNGAAYFVRRELAPSHFRLYRCQWPHSSLSRINFHNDMHINHTACQSL